MTARLFPDMKFKCSPKVYLSRHLSPALVRSKRRHFVFVTAGKDIVITDVLFALAGFIPPPVTSHWFHLRWWRPEISIPCTCAHVCIFENVFFSMSEFRLAWPLPSSLNQNKQTDKEEENKIRSIFNKLSI